MQLSRRAMLQAGLITVGGSLLAACSAQSAGTRSGIVLPTQSRLTPSPGQNVVDQSLTARATTWDLGGPRVATWAYDGSVPGPIIRATAGDLVRITVDNQLPTDTSVHWHGVALHNAADGVPGLTQDAIGPGEKYIYEFVPPDPGTYFYHPHVGVQLDRGLYAPLIIDDPNEAGDYDAEWVVVLDDWVDGTGTTPDEILAGLTSASGGMGDMDMGDSMGEGGMSGMGEVGMGSEGSGFGDVGDVTYPHFLINGRVNTAPAVLRARPRQRVRLRVINAAADTIFAFALGGHRLTVTHTDGFSVKERECSAIYIGMGERYDISVTLDEGAFPLVAKPLGKEGVAMAVIRTSAGEGPSAAMASSLPELKGPILLGTELTPTESSRLPRKDIQQEVKLLLSGGMANYDWAINGAAYPDNETIDVVTQKRVSITVNNMTMMTHPVHLHGHTFALANGLRKDTVLVKPMQTMALEMEADNPGNWAVHCHNIYHAEAGMMAALVYQRPS